MKPQRTWREQYDRVLRWYERFTSITQGKSHTCPTAMLEDDVLAFFQNCHHLKDWLLRDDAISPRVMDREMNGHVAAHRALRLCRDVCNATKHLGRDRSPESEHPGFGAKNLTLDLSQPGGVISVVYWVETDNDDVNAFELATECVALWKAFLDQRGLLQVEASRVVGGPDPLVSAEEMIDRLARAHKTGQP